MAAIAAAQPSRSPFSRLLDCAAAPLWVTPFDGLERYNGARVTVFNSSATPGLPTNRFIAGGEAPARTRWFQTKM